MQRQDVLSQQIYALDSNNQRRFSSNTNNMFHNFNCSFCSHLYYAIVSNSNSFQEVEKVIRIQKVPFLLDMRSNSIMISQSRGAENMELKHREQTLFDYNHVNMSNRAPKISPTTKNTIRSLSVDEQLKTFGEYFSGNWIQNNDILDQTDALARLQISPLVETRSTTNTAIDETEKAASCPACFMRQLDLNW